MNKGTDQAYVVEDTVIVSFGTNHITRAPALLQHSTHPMPAMHHRHQLLSSLFKLHPTPLKPRPQSQPLLLRLASPLLIPKSQADTINTMPLIRRRRIPLALEHMAQMAPAVAAHNLRARHAEGAVRVPRHGAGDAVEIGGPAAPGLELVRRAVEGRGAAGTGVDA